LASGTTPKDNPPTHSLSITLKACYQHE
jgi:hypothetical protein